MSLSEDVVYLRRRWQEQMDYVDRLIAEFSSLRAKIEAAQAKSDEFRRDYLEHMEKYRGTVGGGKIHHL